MKRILLINIILMACIVSSKAQGPEMPAQCEAFYPELLMMNSVLSENEINDFMSNKSFGQNKAPRNKTFWIAYSDRDNNTTYTSPNGKEKYKKLDFKQRVRIAQIKNSYALVYVEPKQSIEYPLFSSDVECMGWIPMKNLLLWHNCLANDIGIFSKALLCFNLDKASKMSNDGYGKVYMSPTDKSKFEKGTTDMNFYFVMKKEGGLSLLARSHTMEGISDDVLYGWVNEQSYVAWNQRSCLEPTWDKAAVEYFTKENVNIKIYSDKEQKVFATGVNFNLKGNGNERDKYQYRMSPTPLRFPILDDNTATLYNCTSFGSLNGQGFVYDTSEDDGNPQVVMENSLEALTNINICLCIDGTSSMEPFYKTVSNAIKEGIKYFAKNDKVRVSAVIYRDYSDGEYVSEVFPLTKPNNDKFYTFLENGGVYGIKSSSKDRTLEEAMYYGINCALDKVEFKPDHSNILFVIGDCGNDIMDSKIKKEDLINKIVEKNVHLMGFQVRTGNEDAYTYFKNQLMDIIKGSLDKKYAALEEKNPGIDVKVKFKELEDGYNLENDVNSILYIGSLYRPYASQKMDLSKLTSLMGQSFNCWSQSVQHKKDLMAGVITNTSGFNVNKTSVDQKLDDSFVRNRVGDDIIEALIESNSLIAFKGYSLRNHKSGRAFFKPVLFISADELTALIERLAPVNDAAILKSNNREPYVNAMKALVKSMIPDELPDEELSKMGYKEIMNLVAGLNESAGALKQDYTIEEIASPQIVKLPVYTQMVNDFKSKFTTLKKTATTNYKYTRKVNGVKYFWLPIEDLP